MAAMRHAPHGSHERGQRHDPDQNAKAVRVFRQDRHRHHEHREVVQQVDELAEQPKRVRGVGNSRTDPEEHDDHASQDGVRPRGLFRPQRDGSHDPESR